MLTPKFTQMKPNPNAASVFEQAGIALVPPRETSSLTYPLPLMPSRSLLPQSRRGLSFPATLEKKPLLSQRLAPGLADDLAGFWMKEKVFWTKNMLKYPIITLLYHMQPMQR